MKVHKFFLIPTNDKIRPFELETNEIELVQKLNFAYENDTLISWTVGLCYVDKPAGETA